MWGGVCAGCRFTSKTLHMGNDCLGIGALRSQSRRSIAESGGDSPDTRPGTRVKPAGRLNVALHPMQAFLSPYLSGLLFSVRARPAGRRRGGRRRVSALSLLVRPTHASNATAQRQKMRRSSCIPSGLRDATSYLTKGQEASSRRAFERHSSEALGTPGCSIPYTEAA